MSDEVIVVVEPPLPDVTVQIEDSLADVVVTVSEVGLVGPRGPVGPEGPPGADSAELLNAHVNSETPHPVYDDGPSLALLYENAKV